MTDMIKNAVTDSRAMRAFLPFSNVDGGVNQDNIWAFMPTVKYGLLKFNEGELPEPLYVSMIQDIQEKLLSYFLTGGSLADLKDDILDMIKDDDFVVILGTNQAFNIEVCFIMDRYGQQQDIYEFRHMIYPTFNRRFDYYLLVQKMLESGLSFKEKDTNIRGV